MLRCIPGSTVPHVLTSHVPVQKPVVSLKLKVGLPKRRYWTSVPLASSRRPRNISPASAPVPRSHRSLDLDLDLPAYWTCALRTSPDTQKFICKKCLQKNGQLLLLQHPKYYLQQQQTPKMKHGRTSVDQCDTPRRKDARDDM